MNTDEYHDDFSLSGDALLPVGVAGFSASPFHLTRALGRSLVGWNFQKQETY